MPIAAIFALGTLATLDTVCVPATIHVTRLRGHVDAVAVEAAVAESPVQPVLVPHDLSRVDVTGAVEEQELQHAAAAAAAAAAVAIKTRTAPVFPALACAAICITTTTTTTTTTINTTAAAATAQHATTISIAAIITQPVPILHGHHPTTAAVSRPEQPALHTLDTLQDRLGQRLMKHVLRPPPLLAAGMHRHQTPPPPPRVVARHVR
jgi:hypothetical protein